jgi:predicted alpha-1,6-mannanase (GH76 family)
VKKQLTGKGKPTAGATTARPIKIVRSPSDRALAERMLERLRHGTDVRSRKVRRIKAAIRVRHYENALKLAVALERMTRAAKRLRA